MCQIEPESHAFVKDRRDPFNKSGPEHSSNVAPCWATSQTGPRLGPGDWCTATPLVQTLRCARRPQGRRRELLGPPQHSTTAQHCSSTTVATAGAPPAVPEGHVQGAQSAERAGTTTAELTTSWRPIELKCVSRASRTARCTAASSAGPSAPRGPASEPDTCSGESGSGTVVGWAGVEEHAFSRGTRQAVEWTQESAVGGHGACTCRNGLGRCTD